MHFLCITSNEAQVTEQLSTLLLPEPADIPDKYDQTNDSIDRQVCNLWIRKWTDAITLPKPNFSYAMNQIAFQPEHLERLMFYGTFQPVNFFPDGRYFPFLVCEVMSAKGNMNNCHQQAVKGAITAVKGIVPLCAYADLGALDDIEARILCYSIENNHERLKILEHFFTRENCEIRYYNYKLFHGELEEDVMEIVGSDCQRVIWSKALAIMREILDDFYKTH
ncbi:hypothetical protein K470DRAFT_267063 [Piedraia hortae CBS 480.64]|uniref:DUF7924 domain-containing protein n=1 Tax=Piedraia hortae CBS 480.64 TaxID=1314780 RepID=A0A6A7BP56_9PEZI|nr:hypothetical protein K470DRAFT_267063 [Piedraia hortae CBS 480.64]